VRYFHSHLLATAQWTSIDDETWASNTKTLKSFLFNVNPFELQDLYDKYLMQQHPLHIVDGVEEFITPALPFPSSEMSRKRDSIMADYYAMCTKLGKDPLRPNDEVITKLLLFIESTGTWNPYSIKYGYSCF
jgi:hypothetical protein